MTEMPAPHHDPGSRDLDQAPELPQRSPVPAQAMPRDLTGDAAVDATLAELAALDPAADPAETLHILMAVQEGLQQRLSATEA